MKSSSDQTAKPTDDRRSPHGERGLKLALEEDKDKDKESLPARGAWIEIVQRINRCTVFRRRSPHGERGLKSSLNWPK